MNLGALILVTTLFVGTAAKVGSGTDLRRAEGAAGGPVLLELFTSEGCSSCPPADKLLQKLDHEGSVKGADLVVLSEHVDYWNHGGWVDPFSSAQFSKRQVAYGSLLHSDVYTPQLVIDGQRQVVGSDRASVEQAIQDSLRLPKVPVVVNAKRDADQVQVHIEIGAIAGNKRAAVYMVLAANEARSHVLRGENAGRELAHVAVVQSLVKIGEMTKGSSFQKDVRSALPPSSETGNLRVAVFVQDGASKRILGVGQDKL